MGAEGLKVRARKHAPRHAVIRVPVREWGEANEIRCVPVRGLLRRVTDGPRATARYRRAGCVREPAA